MSDFELIAFIRAAHLFIGLAFAVMGFMLVYLKVKHQGEITVATGKVMSMTLKDVSPGVAMLAFAMLIIVVSLCRPIRSEKISSSRDGDMMEETYSSPQEWSSETTEGSPEE